MAVNPRLARLIDLVPFIYKHQGIPIKELAEKFGVTVEEIEKDLWLLYCCGLPGQTPLELMEFSFDDGFVTVRNADELKVPRTLTQTELATLIVGLDLIDYSDQQLLTNLKLKLADKFASQIAYVPDGTERYIPEIELAIQNNNVITIVYRGREREVIPFETYEDRGVRYLRAFCKSANERRTFNLSRIEKLDRTDRQELAPNSVPSEMLMNETPIKIHRNPRLVREVFNLATPTGTGSGLKSGDIVKVSYFTEPWLLDQTLALGGAVELLDERLRGQMRSRILASQNLYLR